ncbi:MAG: hypothetical protein IKP12_05675 [Acholeplasmatales bacterium]|nr:hypothetical protein [Acholeplasmatales bacterium]
MDIYTDYANWKLENYDLIESLVKNKSKAISRFTSVIAVVDYLYDKYVEEKKLDNDLELVFSTGFDYIYDQFLMIETLLEKNFNNDINELEKYSKTINLLLYINDFQNEALNYKEGTFDLKPLDDLNDKVMNYLDKHENAPDEYFAILSDITSSMFDNLDQEFHTIDQIYYEIAVELGIYEEDEFNMFNSFINNKIEEDRK